MPTQLKVPQIETRSATISVIQPSEESAERIYEMSFSSDVPVRRNWGNEVLSHDRSSVDWQRMKDGAIPLLFDHSTRDLLGVVEEAWLDGNKGRCRYRWSNDPEAQRRKAQVDEGVLTSASFRYEIQEWEERGNDIIATKWQPIEISLVPCPADSSVGMGRSLDTDPAFPIIVDSDSKDKIMAEVATAERQESPVDLGAIRQAESDRVRSILALEQRYQTELGQDIKDYAEQAIAQGTSIEGARSQVLELLSKRQNPNPISQPVEALGLSNKEQKQYSLMRALRAQRQSNWNDAGFERECSDEISKRLGNRGSAGFYVPMRDLKVDMAHLVGERATYATTVPAAAGRLVATELDAASFIDLLRNIPRCMQLGVRLLSGLVGNVDIPKQTGTGQVFWVAEGGSPADVNATFDLVNLRPKTMGIYQTVTRQMMLQSTPDIENLIRADMLALAALEIDRVIIDGSGAANQPRGILNTLAVNGIAIGANGGAITHDLVIDMETAVADANADGNNLYYMTNAKVVGALKKLKDTTNNYLWVGSTNAGTSTGTPGSLNGYDVARTNQVPKNKSKGTGTNLSSIIFGDFTQVLMGEWGVLEILPNPYGALYTSGGMEYRALFTTDIAIRQPTAFSTITDIVA